MRLTFITLLTLISAIFNFTYSQIKDAQVNLFAIPTLSTSFVRMSSRNASQEIDAVYYNPAGVMSLSNGFHLNVTNQFTWINQNLSVNKYKQIPDAQPKNYPFTVRNYAFPIFTGVYKKNKYAFSFMVAPAIGGGGASSIKNLPFGEFPIADFTALTSGLIELMVDDYHGTNYADIGYKYDFDFKGLSYSPYGQVAFSYKINDYIQFAVGSRFIYSITDAGGGLQNFTLENEALGLSLSPGDYITKIVEDVDVQYPELGLLLADLADALPLELEIEARQTDFGFTPFFGVNFNWHDRWFIGMKYEHKTSINLVTSVAEGKDGAGAYVEGRVTPSDFPGFFSGGVQFRPNDKLTLAIGNRTFFNKRANLNGREEYLISNYKEFDAAFEYKVLPRLKISGGGTYRTVRMENEYYTSVDYFLPALTGTAGFKADINKRMAVEAGFLFTKYITRDYVQDVEIFGGLAPLLLGQELPDIINDNTLRRVDFQMGGHVYYASVGVDFWMGSIEENKIARQARISKVKNDRAENQNKRQKRREIRREDRPGLKVSRVQARQDWLDRRNKTKEERRHEFPEEIKSE